jgi:hypothetical protein
MVFHRTRTDLTKWFLAAYLMGRDKRGVSAKFLQRRHARIAVLPAATGAELGAFQFRRVRLISFGAT